MIGNADKLLCHADRISRYLAGRPVVPITVEIHPSGECNQACVYCDCCHRNDVMMGSPQLNRIMRECQLMGVCGIVWSGGGEPLLNQRFQLLPELIVPSGLITNGSIRMQSNFWQMFRWVRFSVDTFNPSEYNRIRGVPLKKYLKENIESASGVTDVGIQAIVCEGVDLVSFVQEAKSRGVTYVQIRPNENTDNPYWPVNVLRECESLANVGFDVIVRDDKIGSRVNSCVAGHFGITVDVNMKCHVCGCTGSPNVEIGDLKHQTFASVVFGQRRADVLRSLDGSSCPVSCKGANINAAFAGNLFHCEFL